jgi:hypothetical protein
MPKHAAGTTLTAASSTPCLPVHLSLMMPVRSISENTESLPRSFSLSPITHNQLITFLKEYVRDAGRSVDLLLVGGLALQAYGYTDRSTQDVDAEVAGDLDSLARFLRQRQVPADLGENISGWSVVAMPPGYRERASVLLEDSGVRLRLLHPVDFIIAKLRRGTEMDIEDALYVAQRFGVASQAVQVAAEAAVSASPRDTLIFLFRKTVELFCARL